MPRQDDEAPPSDGGDGEDGGRTPQGEGDRGGGRRLTEELGNIDRVLRLTLGWLFLLAAGIGLYQLGGAWKILGALLLAGLAVLTFMNLARRFSDKG